MQKKVITRTPIQCFGFIDTLLKKFKNVHAVL